MNVYILGGGITGLSAAFHTSRLLPSSARITLIEQASHCGGWIQSYRTAENALIETGPRSLRGNNKAVLELINLLNLHKDVLPSGPLAKTRYLQYGSGIEAIPDATLPILTSVLSPILVPAVAKEPFKARNRPEGIEDESVDSFLTRRFGESFAAVFGSALVHGIYAADSRQLSLRTAFPSLWDYETRGNGSVVRGVAMNAISKPKPNTRTDPPYELGDVPQLLKGVSVFSFRGGTGTLPNALVKHLCSQSNVKVLSGEHVQALSLSSDNSVEITTRSSNGTESRHQPTHVISTLPLPQLHSSLSPENGASIPHLLANPYSSVTVVTYVFKSKQRLHPPGFGYLSSRNNPHTKPGGASSNSEDPYLIESLEKNGILGCVFESDVFPDQDSPESDIVKLTAMVGGPYKLFSTSASTGNPSDGPNLDIEKLLNNLLNIIYRRAPGKPVPFLTASPISVTKTHRHNCIPLPLPGHLERMNTMKDILRTGPWKGRLQVVGAGVGGVSVGDCVMQGRLASQSLLQ